LKYVLLAVLVIAIPIIYQGVPAFCKYVCPAGTFGGAGGLLMNPNNADFFDMLGYLFSWKFVLLVIFIVGSIFIYRFFCRFFCPLGAIYGFFNKIALMGVKLDEEKCIDCGLCIQTCQMDIKHVGDHECINCGACIKVCPTQAISWKGSQIFLHSNMVTAPAAAAESTEKVNLLAVGSNGKTATAPLAETITTKTAQEAVKKQTVINPVEEEGKIQPTATGNAIKAPAMVKVKRPKKSKQFWLELAAWIAAAVVLLTALVYYNFLAPTSSTVAYSLGDKCPDFTLTLYESAATKKDDGYYKKISSNVIADDTIYTAGIVTVINFWYTTCDPCVDELPYFAAVKEELGDKVMIVAVQTADTVANTYNFINSTVDRLDGTTLWRDWGILFAQDDEDNVDAYHMFGGKGAFPMTVIIDAEGIIDTVITYKLTQDKLRTEIQRVLNK
ncbi:MAG: 4Fe-4S binding protein, partial [Clostridia bacterium]|nr:4Fe-4S binding protein [Clostridia bacterium]